MKKYGLLLLFCKITFAQIGQQPISFANNDYSIAKQNAFYNANVYLDKNNTIQICAFGGGILFQKNIFEVVENKDSIVDKKWSKLYNEINNKRQWLISQNRIDIYKNNKLVVTKKIPFKSFTKTCFKKNHLYYVNVKNNTISKYDGKKIQVLNHLKDKVLNYQVFYNGNESSIYFIVFYKKKFGVYKEGLNDFKLVKEISADYFFDLEMIHIVNENHFYYTKPIQVENLDLFEYYNNRNVKIANIPYHTRFFRDYLLCKNDFGIFKLKKIVGNKIIDIADIALKDGARNFVFDSISNSIFIGTDNKPTRSFLHIKNYPKLFHKLNSSSIFALSEDNNGKIYAGSYQGAIAIIDKNTSNDFNLKNYFPINGSFKIDEKMYFFDLNNILEINSKGKTTEILANHRGYFGYVSKSKKNVYLGLTESKGLYTANAAQIYKNIAEWKKIDSTRGFNFDKIYTITEDNKNRIWCGSPQEGIGIYDQKTAKALFIKASKINGFGPISSISDLQGGLWFGGYNSNLIYYNANSNLIDTRFFLKIKHPLLEGKSRIMSLAIYDKWLIMGAEDKILLLDLKEYYKSKKIFIRYLNPTECNFTSFIEQNTMLIAKDQSIWFSTSDNLYQLDIKKWLSLPTIKVTPSVSIKKDSVEIDYAPKKHIKFKPIENSFDIEVYYQTKDNLPRFLNGILVKKGEKPIYENPNLQTKFHFANLSSGDYVFYVRVCQQDGSFDVFEYPITIEKFLWQNWWFWLIIALIPIGFMIFYFQKRNQIEKQKKKLSQLNLSSLSNQFRPHFMLNALNSIGSQMEDKPHAEKVISRLGESINILYNFTQQNDFTHEIKNEWKLVENIIEIQRLLFIPDLEFIINGIELFDDKYRVPVGIIQIPVENALLHGLRNKENGSYLLEIKIVELVDTFCISIKDNGVGRQKASQINDFKKNGNGLKTVIDMIKIINDNQANSIIFTIEDTENEAGTIVFIELKKDIDYDKIKF